MPQTHIFLLLLSTSTALTILTASVITTSSEFPLSSYNPFSKNRNPNATIAGRGDDGVGVGDALGLDYSDVDSLSTDLEHQITQLLGQESDAIHTKEDIYPGRGGPRLGERHHPGGQRSGFYGELPSHRYATTHARTVFMPFLRRKIVGWQLEMYYNVMFEPFWPKMRSLLKDWADKRRFEPRVMQHLLRSVKQPIDESYMRNRDAGVNPGKRYRTCAVVGNSGILLNSSYGTSIDRHEMVMRINNAKTAGFERFVGHKTTISFVNSHIIRGCAHRTQCWCHPYGAMVPTITYLCAPWHFMPIAYCSTAHAAPLLVTDPRFDNLCNRIAKWYSVKLFLLNRKAKASWWSILRNSKRAFHYSSGMQAVVLALGICDNVKVFGFGKADGAKHHYFSLQSQELKDIHDYAAEYEFYHDIEKNDTNLLPFFAAAGISSLPSFKLIL